MRVPLSRTVALQKKALRKSPNNIAHQSASTAVEAGNLATLTTIGSRIEFLDLIWTAVYFEGGSRDASQSGLEEQIKRYRDDRRTAAGHCAELHELSCNVAREGIRHQHPDADEAEVERLLRRRLELARR
jgi:hypothetical protein